MVSAIFTPTHIFCDFLSSCASRSCRSLTVNIFQPTGSLVQLLAPDSLAPKKGDEVLAVSNRFCCSSADKTLGRSTWDLQGLGMAWDGLGWPGMWRFPAYFSMDETIWVYRSMNKCTVYILFEHGYPLSKDPNDALDMRNSSCWFQAAKPGSSSRAFVICNASTKGVTTLASKH